GQIMNKLLNQRNQRQAPLLDSKIITSWNGLMIKAFASAAKAFNHDKYLQAAIRAAKFFQQQFEQHGELHHTYNGLQPTTAATLEDYAFLADGVICLAQVNDNKRSWAAFAQQLIEKAYGHFFEEQ